MIRYCSHLLITYVSIDPHYSAAKRFTTLPAQSFMQQLPGSPGTLAEARPRWNFGHLWPCLHILGYTCTVFQQTGIPHIPTIFVNVFQHEEEA